MSWSLSVKPELCFTESRWQVCPSRGCLTACAPSSRHSIRTTSCAGGASFEHRSPNHRDTALELLGTREANLGALLEMRTLRALPRPMSDVPRAGHGDGFAARPHLPDCASGR